MRLEKHVKNRCGGPAAVSNYSTTNYVKTPRMPSVKGALSYRAPVGDLGHGALDRPADAFAIGALDIAHIDVARGQLAAKVDSGVAHT
jgi:hypothetical protein